MRTKKEWLERVVAIERVTKVVKGGIDKREQKKRKRKK